MMNYYADDANYYQATGTVERVFSKDDDGCLLELTDISYHQEADDGDSRTYAIRYKQAQEIWGIWNPEIGMRIDFVSADMIFFDGYTCPIVAISYEGSPVLEFEVGKEKLIEWIRS